MSEAAMQGASGGHGGGGGDGGDGPGGPGAPGMLLIISGPSGVGKTTITHAVERAIPGAVFSVSATTRPCAPGETEGLDYQYVGDAEFDRLIAGGAFLEWAKVFGKRYGTLRGWVQDRLGEGRLVILEIDVQGAVNVKRQVADGYAIFILPPGDDALLERLRARKREPEEIIQRRYAEAQREIAAAKAGGVYDLFIVNDRLDHAMDTAIGAVRHELARRAQP